MNRRKIVKKSVVFLLVLFALAGCTPAEVKKQAKDNKTKHENEFVQIVETELGPDYSVSNVQGYIRSYVSDYSFFPDYSATSQLVGEIDHNGQKYNAMYDFDEGELYSDIFSAEIIDSLAILLGMDTSKILYGCIINHNKRDFPFLFPVSNRTFEDMLVSYKGGNVELYIVTSEDVYGLDFEDYKNICELKQSELNVYILSSDDFKNLDHFKKNYYGIIDTGEKHPVVYYENESKDVYEVYNLKGFVHLDDGFDNKIGDIEVIKY